MKEIIKPILSENMAPTWEGNQVNDRMNYFMPWNFNLSFGTGFQRDF